MGSGVFHLVMLSLILWWLEQLLQDSDLLVGEISAVWFHRCPEPVRMEWMNCEGELQGTPQDPTRAPHPPRTTLPLGWSSLCTKCCQEGDG